MAVAQSLPEFSPAADDSFLETFRRCLAAGEVGGVRGALLRAAEGEIGAIAHVSEWLNTPPGERVAAATCLYHYSITNSDRTGFRNAFLLLASVQTPEPGLLELGLHLIPKISPDLLLAHREWVLQFASRVGPAGLSEFVRALHDAGHFELVAGILQSKASNAIGLGDVALLSATECLWKADYAAVVSRLSSSPVASPRADALRRIAKAFLAPTEEHLTALRDCVIPIEDAWRQVPQRAYAELLLRGGRSDLTGPALRAAGGHPAMALLQRLNDLHAPETDRKHVDPDAHGFILEALRDLNAKGLEPFGAADDEARLWRAVGVFGGNRTDTCTLLEDGELRVVDLPTSRAVAVSLQRALPRLGPDVVLAEFRRLVAKHPGLAPFLAYQGEVLLWLGQYEAALELFTEAWNKTRNRWSYIGLGAALAALGREDEAQKAWDEGAAFHHGSLPGEATRSYRAEIAIRRGDLETAEALVRGGLAARPTRLRAWILYSELALHRGDKQRAKDAFRHAFTLCPGLFSRTPEHWKLLTQWHPDDAMAVVTSIRSQMRGNASSTMFTWFEPSGTFRASPAISTAGFRGFLENIEAMGHKKIVLPATDAPSALDCVSADGTRLQLRLSEAKEGTRAFAVIGRIALSYRSADGGDAYGRPGVQALLAQATSAIRSLPSDVPLDRARAALAQAATSAGWGLA
jgi:tetratricopeptide (TPR) repeat protein